MTATATGLWPDKETAHANCIQAAGFTVAKDGKNLEKFTDADTQKKWTDTYKYPSGGALGTINAVDGDGKAS